MKIIGREIGDDLNSMYGLIEGRASAADRAVEVVLFEGQGLSDVHWTAKKVIISIHSGIPTHSIPHVLAVALQHVRQALDGYPTVTKPRGRDLEGAELVRGALRELVLEPDAEVLIGPMGLDRTWENEQRHQGYKALLEDPPADWDEPDTLGNIFMALQYARLATTHPAQMWKALHKRTQQMLPHAAERGELALSVLKRRRWGSPRACLDSFLYLRKELGLEDIVQIEDGAGNVYSDLPESPVVTGPRFRDAEPQQDPYGMPPGFGAEG